MPNMIEDGIEFLREQQDEHASVDAVYLRGVASVSLKAVPGRTRLQNDDLTSVGVEADYRDFLIEHAKLTSGGITGEPERGDRITTGGDTFEVLSDRGNPVFTWSDTYKRRLRITTVKVANG